MRTFLVVIFGLVLAWTGSYLAYRWNHAEPSGFVLRTTVTYPAGQPVLIQVFEPLAEIDKRLTGTLSRVGG